MSGLSRKLQRTNKDQYTLTIPKHLIQALGWKEKDRVLFSLINGKIVITTPDSKGDEGTARGEEP